MSFLAPIAGAVVGGLTSKKSQSGASQTASKEPWAEAAPWLKDQIKTGQDLQGHYQQNPFNPLQQTGYQNQFADLDHFRSSTAPGMMDFANKLMGSNYQRAPAGSELGQANPYAQALPEQGMPQGLMPQQPQQPTGPGLLGNPAQGPTGQTTPSGGAFSMPQGGQQYGLLDFQAMNPFQNLPQPVAPPVAPGQQQTEEDARRAWLEAERVHQAHGGGA